MAATACAYGFDSGRRPPMQVMASFDDDDDDRGRHCSIIDDHCCVVHGVVMPPPPAPPPPPPPLPPPPRHRHPGLCTEGLGSESSESSGDLDLAGTVADDGIEDCKSQQQQQQHSDDQEEPPTPAPARTRGGKRVFPPPISVIGAAGKPWQYLRAQRGGGRLVLREVRIPSRELLHACREDGRLKLHFAHPEPEERHHHLADDHECCNN